jgi:hypothetical protein
MTAFGQLTSSCLSTTNKRVRTGASDWLGLALLAALLLLSPAFLSLLFPSACYAGGDLLASTNLNAGSWLLAQTTEPQTTEAEPTPGVGDELLNNLHLSGFLQSTAGVFINTEGTKWWPHHHLNSIENLRQFAQIDANESYGEHLQFFARFWLVYEPSYPFENDARIGAHNLSDFYFPRSVAQAKVGAADDFHGKADRRMG